MSGRDLENEFQIWAAATGNNWWFTAKPVTATEFLIRFPTTKIIDELSHFGKLFMKTIPKVVIELAKWNGIFSQKCNWRESGLELQGFL